MTEFQKTKFIFIALIFCGIFGLAESSQAAEPATYYVDDNACSDNYAGTSISQPLCTFSEAMTKLQAGDTLLIKDGTYNQSLNVTVSGISGSPITITAQNDGQMVVDGQGVRQPLSVFGQDYLNIEGITFKNSNTDTCGIGGGSTNINLKRSGCINSGTGNYHLLAITGASHDILIEDCFMTQITSGRYGILVFAGSHDVTLRRNYVKHIGHAGGGGPCAAISFYGGNNSLVENNVLDLTAMPASCGSNEKGFGYSPALYGDGNNVTWNGNVSIGHPMNTNITDLHGISPDNCTWQTSGWSYTNNVYITNGAGVMFDDAPNNSFLNNNFIDITNTPGEQAIVARNEPGCSNAVSSATVEGNSFLTVDYALGAQNGTTVTADYNNFSNIGIAQTYAYGSGTITNSNPKSITPAYNTATYGNGAYLVVPVALRGQGKSGGDIGAQVLYRYQAGILTSQPLWPWPMEDRIKNETGYSVTYESAGGLWKTLCDAYGEGDGCNDDITPPASPSGLTVQ